ncbi:MAG: hypothetical protein ABSG44_18605 [Thermodesulfobacteriota bacterium]|jgi:hypothetical protein
MAKGKNRSYGHTAEDHWLIFRLQQILTEKYGIMTPYLVLILQEAEFGQK